MLGREGERDDASDQIVDVTKRARLSARAKDGDWLVLECLTYESGNRAAIECAHARAVRIEDPHDRRVDALLAVIRHRHRLGVTLRLVVDAARTDRVDVAPVRLGLRVDQRVAVDLTRRGSQEASTLGFRETEGIVRAVRADLQGLQWQAQVVNRAGRGSEVEHEIDVARNLDVRRDVVLDKREVVVAQMRNIRQRARVEVVETPDLVARCKQPLTEMRSEKSCSTGDDSCWHTDDGTPTG